MSLKYRTGVRPCAVVTINCLTEIQISEDLKLQTTSAVRCTVRSQPVHRTATYRCDDTRCCIIQF